MTDRIRHRGPDDEGFLFLDRTLQRAEICFGSDTPKSVFHSGYHYTTGLIDLKSANQEFYIGLGHRRLSVIDLSSAGHQPLSYDHGKYWIIFNGEIYNHNELKNELIRFGHTFISRTDTEVIVAAYKQWGKECLSHFNGMWAFILIDIYNKKAFIARDRFGVKPLYYWRAPNGLLAFASEIKAFTSLPGWQAILDKQMAFDFLEWGITDHTSHTMFDGVSQLRGGHYIELALGEQYATIQPSKYYEIRSRRSNLDFYEASNIFKNLLNDSVRLRLISDVPVGSCLSGGLDSSSIVCLMNDILHQEGDKNLQRTFSAYSEEKSTDESEYIEEVIEKRKIESNVITPTLEYFSENIDDLVWSQDEPFNTTSPFAQWCVFKLAKNKGIVVMLDGQGADEILAGYHNSFETYLASLLKKGKIFTFIREFKAIKDLYKYNNANIIKKIIDVSISDEPKYLIKKILNDRRKPIWYDSSVLQTKGSDIILECLRRRTTLVDLILTEVEFTSLPKLLKFEDRNSMAHSVEARVPFLDYRLVEFALSVPDDFLIKRGITKRILRQSMDGIIPEKIKNRVTKLGFATPEEHWLRSNPELFLELMKKSIGSSNGIIRIEGLDNIKKMIEGEIEFNTQAWRAICFGIWSKQFNVKLT